MERHEDKRRLKELEVENFRLKKMFAEIQLRHEVLNDAVDTLRKMKSDRQRRN